MAGAVENLNQARELGHHKARLQHPEIDLSRCLGCGACVQACPEKDVLGLVHGQAVLVHAAHCVGHGQCAEACPVDAIALTLADWKERRDIPVVDGRFEVPGQRGLFLAGEITGRALIRTAIAQGRAVASEVAQRSRAKQGLDLVVIGAGPAGLACALEAKAQGLSVELIDQNPLGGTVSQYPRAKLVMTRPVELPLFGSLDKPVYTKEELLGIWQQVLSEQQIKLHQGVRFVGATQAVDGWTVKTSSGELNTRQVCMAIGRRGSPRKLPVPGADLEKVFSALLDPRDHRGERILVVGGGDSAVEAALVLSLQEETRVTLSYRGNEFSRLQPRNASALARAESEARLRVLRQSQVQAVEAEMVRLVGADGEVLELENDSVFALLGGETPYPTLEALGVSFDPQERPLELNQTGQGPVLLRGLIAVLLLALAGLAWVLWKREYYALPLGERPLHGAHESLRPSGILGMTLGILASILVLSNLLYVLRKAGFRWVRFASLRTWMGWHVVAGLSSLIAAALHGAMRAGDTTGGHTLWALAVVVCTGTMGRYLYSFLPRAANGRELELSEVRAELALATGELEEHGAAFGERVRGEVDRLVGGAHWRGSWPKRLWALLRSRPRLLDSLRRLRAEAREQGLSRDQAEQGCALVRRAHRAALGASHFEDLRFVMASWRYLHRWVALLLLLLLCAHVFDALRYGRLLD